MSARDLSNGPNQPITSTICILFKIFFHLFSDVQFFTIIFKNFSHHSLRFMSCNSKKTRISINVKQIQLLLTGNYKVWVTEGAFIIKNSSLCAYAPFQIINNTIFFQYNGKNKLQTLLRRLFIYFGMQTLHLVVIMISYKSN